MNCYKTKPYAVYNHLCNLGYRRDLELLNSLDYEENNVMESMPRYFMGNNIEYMKKIFALSQNNDKIIHELAIKLIKELCTMSNAKNLLNSKENKINNILKENNLELSSYSLDILLSELEKSNEYNEIEDETEQLIYNFFKNNLSNLIDSI